MITVVHHENFQRLSDTKTLTYRLALLELGSLLLPSLLLAFPLLQEGLGNQDIIVRGNTIAH